MIPPEADQPRPGVVLLQAFNLTADFTDQAAEQSVIAAVARKPELYWELADLLPPDAFAHEGEAWQQVAVAVESERPPAVPAWEPAADPRAAAERLAELLRQRLLAESLANLAADLYGGKPAGELLARLEEEAARVQAAVRELRAGEALAVTALFPQVLNTLRQRREAVKTQGAGAVGLPTGIAKLDKFLGGLQPGLHLLAAEPGQGKTTLCLQIGANVARAGFPVLFLTFEEAPERLALKVVCQRAGLEMKRYAEGYGEPAEVERAMRQYGPELAPFHIIEGSARLTVGQVRGKALQLMAKHKAPRCFVVVDYLQRWAASRREFTDFRHVVSGLVSELRELALRLDSPVLAISIQNRPGQGRAALTSLKESGDLEYSADTALFLVEADKRPATPPSRAVDLAIEKNRFGDTGIVQLIFQPHLGSLREVAKT